jgi:hypothetical protein
MCISGTVTSNITSLPSGSCPQESTWNGVGCSLNGGSKNCAAGAYWNGNSCLTSQNGLGSLCSENQYWNGSQCVNMVGTGSQSCNQGYYFFMPSKSCLVQM